jgi:hypothetical protein
VDLAVAAGGEFDNEVFYPQEDLFALPQMCFAGTSH